MKIEFTGIKTYINSQLVIIPESKIDELKKLPNDELCEIILKQSVKRQRCLKQLGLYWAACKFISDNTENRNMVNAEMVDEWCKKSCNLIEFTQYFTLPDGTILKHEKTGSISFANLNHLDACGYFTDAFLVMANFIGLSVDDFIDAVKQTMGG